MTGVQTCALPISHAGQSHWVPAFAGMTAPGAVAGTACCVLAGVTNSRVPARTAIIRIARPGTTDALVAPPPAERRLRRADRRLHARCVRVRSEEHTSELQSLMRISYAVFCLKKK